ncbi:xanthine dehydrogenase family protein molybdopterin-binding subunit [Plantactinospora sp. KLBMP9567]|uniref:xanthine dehydrogenase family protein molybdopterin-binding subunit n=1 Tax=Plantactinospora sp. KLBMP9567 TaxID=3085900 RepID=UPI00298261D2|nr:molybdopterin cofactor-binding domain-containing protein [Plantactinospora sp. KLBMP9567]MDW5324902.1 molybdopterin cofactor-binding domain-containing protein [Plantactinospora sp. KLBMP9567]
MSVDRRDSAPAAPPLPRGVVGNPRLARWITVRRDGTVTVRVGKVELGQGILTALAQLAADELDVDLGAVAMAAASTAEGPDEGLTAGSLSVADSGAAVRQVCAEVRALFVAEAVATLALDPDTVTVQNGVITDADGSRHTSYGELAERVDLDREATGAVRPKPRHQARWVGTSVPRLDLPDKVSGRPRFIQDLALPGQLSGRVVRPPSPAATLVEVDTAAARVLPGVQAVVRDGDFLGVVAEGEENAERAASALAAAARWHEEPTLPDEEEISRFLRDGPAESIPVPEPGRPGPAGRPAGGQPGGAARPDATGRSGLTEGSGPVELPEPTRAAGRVDGADEAAPDAVRGAGTGQVVRRLWATYSRPFLAHASMAPSCGAARWAEDGSAVSVWSHSQGIHALGRAIGTALGLDADRVDVRHVESAGSYGHNGADDAAFDAVLLARAVPGRPVHVRWSRRDELTWAPFGSAMVAEVEAGVAADGTVLTWSYDVWSQGHTARPGYAGSPGLLAATHRDRSRPTPPAADPPASGGGGTTRNAWPIYTFPERRIHGHRALRTALRSSSLRSLGAFTNVFAIESFMDELALAAGADPVAYRLAQLADPRAREVLSTAAELGGWQRRGTEEHVGHGIGFARYKDRGAYCAVLAEVQAEHEVRVRRLTLVVDVGRVVNPDGVRNQIEGGAVQATSWTLKERVRFDRWRVTSADWESYPILRFSEVPQVDVHLMDRPAEPSVGAGEAAQGPTAAAVANAVADAISVRVRDLPITTDRIVAAL